MTDHIMPTYASLPIRFTRGEGAWLWDENNKQYLDALSGIAVCSLGHANPEVAEAISKQASTLLHTSNLYRIANQEQLADKLCQLSNMQQVFFSNSGAEANEAAIKIARKYGHSKGIEKPLIICMNGSFHGRTLATLTATGNPKVKEGFGPLPEGFTHLPYNDIDAVEALAKKQDNIVAILVEPIQGEGGVIIPSDDYLNKLQQLCQQNGWLLMLDEIQTGIARTGRFLASQLTGVEADVITLAKALGNGVPIGACLTSGKAAGLMQAGSHGSTFGGSPLASAAALAVLNIVERDNIAQQAQDMGNYISSQFKQALQDNPQVVEVRNKGMMIAIELSSEQPGLVAQALEKGLLINVAAGNVIRLLPPLTINHQQADQIVSTVCELIKSLA